MKIFVFSIFLCLSAIEGFGQVTLDHTFPGNVTVVLFSANGEKYEYNDTTNVYLYNMDYSLWKMITPTHYANYVVTYVSGVSDYFFNSDNLVELVVTYSTSVSGIYSPFKSELINETGTVLLSMDSCYGGSAHYDETSGSFKFLTNNFLTHPNSMSVYSVPGTLPCGHCGYLGVERLSRSSENITISDPAPNPSEGVVRITYTLPANTPNANIIFYNSLGQVVKILPVMPQFNAIEINNTVLPAGNYMYQIKAGNTTSESRMMLIR